MKISNEEDDFVIQAIIMNSLSAFLKLHKANDEKSDHLEFKLFVAKEQRKK